MISKKLPDRDKVIFSPSEACGYLGVSWNTLKKYLQEGEISYRRKGRRYFISREDLNDFIDKNKNKNKLFAKTILNSISNNP